MATTSLQTLKQRVIWKDLLSYKRIEVVKELLLPIPWLFLSLWAGHHFQSSPYWLPLVLVAAFYFFLTGLRLAHNAFHYCLGLSKKADKTIFWSSCQNWFFYTLLFFIFVDLVLFDGKVNVNVKSNSIKLYIFCFSVVTRACVSLPAFLYFNKVNHLTNIMV